MLMCKKVMEVLQSEAEAFEVDFSRSSMVFTNDNFQIEKLQ